MARNKSRKKSSNKNKENRKNSLETKQEKLSVTSPVQAEAEKEKIPETINESVSGGKISAGVRLSTCIAGMFITFVLGAYLGSFLPGILNGMREEKQVAQIQESIQIVPEETTPKPPAPEKATIPQENANSPLSQEFATHLSHMEKEALAHPEDSRIWSELGNAYFDNHEPQKAISAYTHSLNISPDNPDVWTDMGIMYREIKDYDKAVECFRKASSQNPNHINALFNEGVVLSSDLNRKNEAIAAWKRILEINPQAMTPNGLKIADLVQSLQ